VDVAEAELFRQFKPYELAADALLPDAELSRKRLLAGLQAAQRSAQQIRGFPSSFALASAGIVAGAGCVAFFALMLFHHTPATVDSVLFRAVKAERTMGTSGRGGILYQRVVLRKGSQQIVWPVYRDIEGRRSPHFRADSSGEAALTAEIAEAGVSREDPLSATSFKSWHDRFRIHSDSIQVAPSGLIVVKTLVPASESDIVREESITLRGQDFHAVARTIGFRNSETIEIAELDYRMIPWRDAPQDWFYETSPPLVPSNHAEAVPSIPRIAPISDTQLTLAELQARLVLSRAGADFNEQIELKRQPEGILVSGLANSPERKRELQSALDRISHVTSKIITVEELQASASPKSPSAEVDSGSPKKSIESVSQPSPLTLYWKEQKRDAKEVSEISRRLLASALVICQQSLALKEMVSSFRGIGNADEETRTAYRSLWREHQSRLQAAVDDQLKLLDDIAPSPISAGAGAPAGTETMSELNSAAADSMELSRELTSGDNDSPRDATKLLHELHVQSLLITNLSAQLSAESH
jgi:hypothetical protein